MADGVINCAGLLFSGLVGIILVPIMLRGLGAELYGLWVAALAVSGIAGVFDFGLGWSVTREVAAAERGEGCESTVRFVAATGNTYLLLGLVGAVFVAGLGLPFSKALGLSAVSQKAAIAVFGLVGLAHLADRMLAFEIDVLHGLRRFGTLNLLTAAAVLLRAGGIFGLLFAGASVVAIAAWQAAASAATTVAAAVVVGWMAPRYRLCVGRFHWSLIRAHMLFGFTTHLGRKLGDVVWQIAPLAIGVLRGSASIVPYYVGQRFPFAVSAINWSAAEVFFPAASEHQRAGDLSRSQEVLEVGTRWTVVLVLPLCLVLGVIAPNLIKAWLGTLPPDAVAVLRLVAATALAEAFGVGALHVLWGRGAARTVLFVAVGAALGTLGLSLWLLNRMGIVGAAWGLLLPMSLGSMASLSYASHGTGTRTADLLRRTMDGLWLPVLASLAVTLAVTTLLQPASWVGIIAVALAGGTAYVLTLYFGGAGRGARQEERMFAREVLRLPMTVARYLYRGLRRILRRVGFLRSTYYLLLAGREAMTDSSASGRAELDHTFGPKPDPWDYETIEVRGRRRFQREVEMLDAVRGGARFQRVLEVGCAEGAFTELLAERSESLLAVDISPVALARARSRRQWGDHVRFDQWDLRSLHRAALPGTFDLIVIVHVMNYIRSPRFLRAVRVKLVEGLCPGGYLLLGNESQPDAVMGNSWWSRYLIRGGKWINAFITEHPALRVIDTAALDLGDCLSLEVLCQKIR
jgi:O-antigen/teichoic acid export membrane protein/SAM-dependent methyltransferase